MVRIKFLIVYLSSGHPRNNGVPLQNTQNTENFEICVIVIQKTSKSLFSPERVKNQVLSVFTVSIMNKNGSPIIGYHVGNLEMLFTPLNFE